MNELFLKRIQTYIPDEYEAFVRSLDEKPCRAVRINSRKASPDAEKRFPHLKESPFVPGMWYVQEQLGLHPYHIAGLLYMQEPSAGSVVQLLDIGEDDLVLDVCAAPGSKTTQIAEKIRTGMLVSNEIDPKRAQALLSNMERMGVSNFAVVSSDTKTLSKGLPDASFDKILVDAPCSGEGMIKKHAAAIDEWSIENIRLCAKRQKEILSNVVPLLKGGGTLVYSTCTYAREENEEIVAWALQQFEELELADADVSFGRPGLDTEGMDAQKVRRIFPMDGGEGQFMAKFIKKGNEAEEIRSLKNEKLSKTERAFLDEQIEKPLTYFHHENGKLFMMDHPFMDLKKVKVLRQGVLVGEEKKNRFEPVHAFYMNADLRFKKKMDCTLEQMDDVMHGLQIVSDGQKGFVALAYDSHVFGFGKSDGSRLNNKIPKGLRLLEKSHIYKEVTK